MSFSLLVYNRPQTPNNVCVNLQRLELEILEILNRINLRKTVDEVAKAGERLAEAKRQLSQGEWLPWLHRMGLKKRNAQIYMQVAEAWDGDAQSAALSINAFLRIIRKAKSAGHYAEMEERRRAAIAANPPIDSMYQVHHHDCRTFPWPAEIDVIATDPPWANREAYQWLAGMAMEHLVDGGFLIVQCGTNDLLDRGNIFSEAGLTYRWMLNITFDSLNQPTIPSLGFISCWRPVYLFVKGKMPNRGGSVFSDTWTVKANDPAFKVHHRWEQPLRPWVHFLKNLSAPGNLIADPFAGSATNGVAVKMLGDGRKYLGTEINADDCLVARQRLAGVAA